MTSHTRLLLAFAALSCTVAACGDVTSPASQATVALPQFGRVGSGVDTSVVVGGGSGGGGGGGGGSTAASCGVLSATVQTYNIVVYTTRIGIGFSGTAVNCGSRNEALEVDVVDVNTDPVCAVNVPHFIAPRNSAPGESISWSANSTLVNCMNTTHTFVLTLVDTKTGQKLATTTASAFL